MEPKRPAKLVSRPKDTAKIHKRSHNGTKGSLPNPLLFVNVSNPAEGKRKDSRKAVRSFVMKQYQQSRKQNEHHQLQKEELEGEDDAVEDGQERLQTPVNADILHPSCRSDTSRDVEEIQLISAQNRSLSPNLAHVKSRSSPLSILGNGSFDPFDSYPSQVDTRAHHLIYLCKCRQSWSAAVLGKCRRMAVKAPHHIRSLTDWAHRSKHDRHFP